MFFFETKLLYTSVCRSHSNELACLIIFIFGSNFSNRHFFLNPRNENISLNALTLDFNIKETNILSGSRGPASAAKMLTYKNEGIYCRHL